MKKKRSDFIKWFGPLIEALKQLGDSGRPREVSDRIAKNLNLPDQLLDETLKSGGSKFHNQVAWARQYLVWEGLLDASKHGTWKLTDKGRVAGQISEDEAHKIFLKWVAIHSEARKGKGTVESSQSVERLSLEEEAPGAPSVRDEIRLIDILRNLSPIGFEKVCRELLRESGFENVEITGGSADGGIDGYGTLEINAFVSFKVLFQCKRYKEGNPVSRAQVGDFRNAMIGRAEKGIIMTTSTFSNAAIQEAQRDGAPKVELVDGAMLVKMFEKVELGLTKRVVFDVDLAYFEKYQ